MTRTNLLPLLAATVLATATLGGCEEFLNLPFGDKTDVHYWGDLFLDMYEDELVVGELEPGPGKLAEPRAVLLITGVTIPERWFDPIKARLERDGFVPYVWEPPELLSYSLFQASEDLGEVVQEVLEDSGQDRSPRGQRSGPHRHPRGVHGRGHRAALCAVARWRGARVPARDVRFAAEGRRQGPARRDDRRLAGAVGPVTRQ